MDRTVPTQLIAYLKNSTIAVASAELQRLPFKNRNGSTASPKAISRRLQELAEDKTTSVEYRGKNAYYSFNPASEPPRHIFVPVILPDGTRAVREVVEATVSPDSARTGVFILVGLESAIDPWTGAPTGELREIYA